MDTTPFMVWDYCLLQLLGSSVHVLIPRSDVSSDVLTALGKIDIKHFKCREEEISAATFLKLDACLHDNNNGSLLDIFTISYGLCDHQDQARQVLCSFGNHQATNYIQTSPALHLCQL